MANEQENTVERNPVPEPLYYSLRCVDCNKTFLPVVSTQQHELMYPDWEQCEQQVGVRNTEQLRQFHADHAGHVLTAHDSAMVG